MPSNTLSIVERISRLETIINQYFSIQNINEDEETEPLDHENVKTNFWGKNDDLNLNINQAKEAKIIKIHTDKNENQPQNVQKNPNIHAPSTKPVKKDSIKGITQTQLKGNN